MGGTRVSRWEEQAMFLECAASSEIPLVDLTYRNVNVFTVHFNYVFELFFHTIPQLVLQICIVSLSHEGWTWEAVASITISAFLIVNQFARYGYWFLVQPLIDGKPWRQQLAAAHLSMFGTYDQENSD